MFKKALAIFSLGFLAAAAQAATYSNNADSTIFSLGAPDTTSYGQTFNLASTEVLNSWSFFAITGGAGNVHLVVASWDGTANKPIGPALFNSASLAYGGGDQALGFNSINLQLGAGAYIAYLSVAGEASPLTGVTVKGSSTNGGLDGGFTFLNSNGADPLVAGSAWLLPGTWSSAQSMNYTATFSAAVPEPETYGLMAAGLVALAMSGRLRRTRHPA